MYRNKCFVAAISFAASMTFGGAAFATDDVAVTVTKYTQPLSAAEIDHAKPFANPLKAPDTSRVKAEAPESGLMPVVALPGGTPRETRAFGSFGIPYTTTRVQAYMNLPLTAPNMLSTTYPYSAVGKLTFTTPNGNAFCSATVIRKSLIVTAAHCVENFGNPTIFTNYAFQPGHYGPLGATDAQKAPFGTWKTRMVARSNTWVKGTDIGSGGARDNDLAVFVIAKQGANFVGAITGYITYGINNYSFKSSAKTGNLAVAAMTTLGYPALMDSGEIMQRADGPTYTTTVSGANQLWQGNNFTGGSSGGPWIVNFSAFAATLSGGAVVGSESNMAIVGVTSWGSADPNASKDNYSSQFRQNTQFPKADYGGYGPGNIGSLVNTACNANAGGGQTYKQLGYCD